MRRRSPRGSPQQRRRHGIAVVIDQPSAAGSSRDRERSGARSQVRHHLAQLTERSRSGSPDFGDILLGAPAGRRPLAHYRRGSTREPLTIQRKGRRLDARRADVEPDQEIAGQSHRRSMVHGFVLPTVPWRPWRHVNGRALSAIEHEGSE
jgi:hypothetical protein